MANPETLLQRAGDHAQSGDRGGAIDCLAALLDLARVPAQIMLSAAFQAYQLADIDLAERLLRRCLETDPEFAPAHTNLGNILRQQGRLDDAIAATQTACQLAPRDPMNLVNLGTLQEDNRRPDLAEASFRDALALAPGEPQLLDGLGRVLLKLGRPSEALRFLQQALAKQPRLVAAHVNLGNLHQKAEQLPAAAAAYEAALHIEPDHFVALGNLALIHSRQGRAAAAEAGFRRAMELAPGDPIAFNNLAQLHYRRGEFAAAIQACDGALAGDPGNRDALSNKVIVLNEMGDHAAAGYLQNFESFVVAQPVDVPKDYASLAAFNEALFTEVTAVPDRFSEPGAAVARQTLDLMLQPGPAVRAYGAMINQAVEDYVMRLPDDAAHPFCASRPRAWRLEAWGTITQRIEPGEDSHIHPSAWLSGVYYTRLPKAVCDKRNNEGCLEIGRAPKHLGQKVAPALRIIRPEAGLLVLFPSFFYHRILPFSADSTRMSVAFDAVPV